MVANKYTKKEVILFCDEITSLLSTLKLNEKNKEDIKKYEKLQKQSEKCKNLIDRTKNNKNIRKKSNYNNYIEDCFLIKKGEKTSGVLPKNIENELFADIKKHDNNNYFSLFGKYWKTKINEDIKDKYKNRDEQKNLNEDIKEKHRGRPKKNINN
jgi:hypothetical protein